MAAVREVSKKLNEEKAEVLKDEINKLENDLEASEKRAEEAEKAEDAMYDEFQNDIKKQLDAKFAEFQTGRSSLALDDIQSRLYTSHIDESSQMIKAMQSDVMLTNKIIKEVSRGISTEWKPIFEYLMAAQMSKTEIKKLIEQIERQNRPLMQAYKALNIWKDMKGEEITINQLADALRINKKEEWSNYVLDAVECEGDSFYKLKPPCDKPEGGAEGDEKGKPTLKKSDKPAGALDDRKFLKIAKKIGGEWEKVATTLGLAEEDIQEIMQGAGATYQGAFKMLWTWRDNTIELDQDNAQILREALKASGKEDVAELV